MAIGFGILWLIISRSRDLCLDGGTYCQQKFCGQPDKIKLCDQESIDQWNRATPEEKAATKRVLEYGKDK